MTDWLDAYADTDDPNDRYRLLRRELTRLRDEGQDEEELFDRDAVADTVRRLNGEVAGDLVVFVANDFGLPMAYRPEDAGVELQDAVRRAILEHKYDSQADLAGLREALLEAHPRVHKAIVAVLEGSSLRYHLPEGSSQSTNFVTVREMVGLIDYTTNSAQREGLSRTY